MARRRFFVPDVRRGRAELVGEEAEHLVRVLRAEVGQMYEISDNRDVYLARVTVARKSVVEFEVIEELPSEGELVKVSLIAALIKFDRFEVMVEKATELGVSEIIPVEAVRTERGLAQAAVKRQARWERIAVEASQQARRVTLPEIQPVKRFGASLVSDAEVKLLLDEDAETTGILNVLPKAVAGSVALLVGPEGGWTEEERSQALASGWQSCSLGKTVLRAETAALAGLAVVRAWSGAR
jgi:16S rRNA (uracil1498-N3)-methyltransferase